MTRLAHMDFFRDPFLSRRRRRRRRPPHRGQAQRPRVVGRAAPRPVTWWVALGALLLAWWFPALAGAQGLRSTTTSVSLVAVRQPDAPPRVLDIPWDTGIDDSTAVWSVHLADGPGARLLVRDAAGRLQPVAAQGTTVRGPRIGFRWVGPGNTRGDGPWRVILRVRRSDGRVDERQHEVRLP